MPITVVCPDCSTKLTAPDAAAGKKLKCPKCQAVCPVPAPKAPQFEVVHDSSPPVATGGRSGPRGRGRAATDADEYEDDDRPRRKDRRDGQKAGRSSGLPVAGIVAGVFALVLFLGGGLFAAYWFGFRDKGEGAGGEGVGLENWETYTSPANVFKASFPGKPEAVDWKPLLGTVKVTSDIREYQIGEKHIQKPHLAFFAGYVRFSEGVQPAVVREAKDWLVARRASSPAQGLGLGSSWSPKKVTAGGREWEEVKMDSGPLGSGLARWHQAGPVLYLVGYRSQNRPPDAAAAEKFLASYEILGGDPGDPDPDPIRVPLDNWQPYTSSANVFKASFPGETKPMTNYLFATAKTAEFRQHTIRDEKSGKIRTYFAGYATFVKPPTYRDERDVLAFAQREALGGTTTTGRRRVPFGGWPWGEELKLEAARSGSGGTNGIVRWVKAGSTLYVAGMKNTAKFPPEKEAEKLFGSFEILAAKPQPKDLEMPPDWAEYRQSDGDFRAAMPRQVFKQDRAVKQDGDSKYAGIPIVSLTEYKGHDLNADLVVYVIRFRPNTPEADRKRILEVLAATAPSSYRGAIPKVDSRKKITWAGRDAEEVVYSPAGVCAARQAHTDTIGYLVIATDKGGTLNPDIARVFLNSFTFGK